MRRSPHPPWTRRHSLWASAVIWLALLGPAAPAAHAEDHGAVFAGGLIDEARTGYLGGEIALPGSSLGKGLALRGAGFLGDYSYQGGPTGRVDADFNGGEIDALYQWSGAWGWADGAVGARYVATSLSPFDPANRRHGRQGELALSTDGARLMGKWRFDWYGAYGERLSDYQVRFSLTHQLGAIIRGGLETAVEGDPTYDLVRVGPYAGLGLGSRSELQLSFGASTQSGRSAAAYGRISIYRTF